MALLIKTILVNLLKEDSTGKSEVDKLINYYRNDRKEYKKLLHDKQFLSLISRVEDLNTVSVTLILTTLQSVHVVKTVLFMLLKEAQPKIKEGE